MVTNSRLVRRSVLLSILVAIAVSTSACEEASPGSSPESRLIVLPDDTAEAMFGSVSGTLSINSQGCYAIGDHVLVVGKGSRILDQGDSIEIADVGTVELGERASGSGGYIDGIEEVEHYAQALGLPDEVMGCQPDEANASIAVLDPASS